VHIQISALRVSQIHSLACTHSGRNSPNLALQWVHVRNLAAGWLLRFFCHISHHFPQLLAFHLFTSPLQVSFPVYISLLTFLRSLLTFFRFIFIFLCTRTIKLSSIVSVDKNIKKNPKKFTEWRQLWEFSEFQYLALLSGTPLVSFVYVSFTGLFSYVYFSFICICLFSASLLVGRSSRFIRIRLLYRSHSSCVGLFRLFVRSLRSCWLLTFFPHHTYLASAPQSKRDTISQQVSALFYFAY